MRRKTWAGDWDLETQSLEVEVGEYQLTPVVDWIVAAAAAVDAVVNSLWSNFNAAP